MTDLQVDPSELYAAITKAFDDFDESSTSGAGDPRNNIVNVICSIPELATTYREDGIFDRIVAYVNGLSDEDKKWIIGRTSEKEENNGVNSDGSIKLRGKKEKKEEKAS
jgi:hypothetical protein